jgi:hypothetical protein
MVSKTVLKARRGAAFGSTKRFEIGE